MVTTPAGSAALDSRKLAGQRLGYFASVNLGHGYQHRDAHIARVGGVAIDRLSKESERAAVWVALVAMVGGLIAAFAVFNFFDLTLVMVSGFFLGLISFMALPAVNVILFSVIPPETKATTIATSNVILNLVIAVITFLIGAMSDASELRLAFSGVVIAMFALGMGVCIALLRSFPKDVADQKELLRARSGG